MDWQSILIAALGVGIGGGVGALIGKGLARLAPQGWRRGVEIGCAVVLAVIGARVAVMIAGPPSAGANPSIERQLLNDPTFGPMASAWRETDPASFDVYLGRVASAAGGNRAAAIEQARAELMEAARPRIPNLSDAQLVEVIRLARDQMRELKASHPIVCYPLFQGRRFGDISPYLSQALIQRETNLLTAAFRANPNAQQPALAEAELVAEINDLVARTRAQFGEDIALIAPDAQVEGREPRVCDAAAALYDQMLAMPEPQAAALMRGLSALSN
ncbi:MAG: hypothetical protein NW206_03060 [Hyphomonadaceae bacterium]|nr:hypothetical protein [Hyphomonadaceae bacterium]